MKKRGEKEGEAGGEIERGKKRKREKGKGRKELMEREIGGKTSYV